jgi:UDP:flavonoid glycosyltransferase YjiC (YdhE family)
MALKKVLFISHAVTMAHLGRPLCWLESLDRHEYDIYFGCSPSYKSLIPQEGVTFIPMTGIDPVKFGRSVDRGGLIYDAASFEEHILEDLAVLEQVKPDLVIGDFRHSLSVSCRLKKIKYINITNAYWSPNIDMPFPLPESPVIRILGEKWAPRLVGWILPFIIKFNFFKMAFELRKSMQRVGLKFTDYRQIITDGDLTLYFDTNHLVPLKKITDHEKFMGPLFWSMPVPLPDWWQKLDLTKKRLFVSLGSSGNISVLPMILKTLAKMDVEIIVALSGKTVNIPIYPNVHVTNFLPIEMACGLADLVICNGGSPMGHAALTFGVPTIGIISNNDQLLNMAHLEKLGAGLMLRYWNLSDEKIKNSVSQILNDETFKLAAQKIKKEIAQMDVQKKLQDIIADNI